MVAKRMPSQSGLLCTYIPSLFLASFTHFPSLLKEAQGVAYRAGDLLRPLRFGNCFWHRWVPLASHVSFALNPSNIFYKPCADYLLSCRSSQRLAAGQLCTCTTLGSTLGHLSLDSSLTFVPVVFFFARVGLSCCLGLHLHSITISPAFQQLNSVTCCFNICTIYILPSYGNRLLRNLMTVYSFPKCYILPHIGEYFLPVFVFVFHAPTLVCFWSVRRLCLPSALLQQDSFNRIPSCSHGIPTIFTSLSIIHPTR